MKKQRFQFGISGYRWAPESFHASKGLVGQRKKDIPLTEEERREVGYRFLTEGFHAAVGHVKHIERMREREKQCYSGFQPTPENLANRCMKGRNIDMSDSLQMDRLMRATIDAKTFSDALKKVSVVLKKCAVPILEEVYVRFTGGHCTLTATNLDAWIIIEFPAHGDDFAFVFSRSKDVERACRYFSGDISLDMDATGDGKHSHPVITISSGSRAGEFDAHPAEDYPDVPKLQGEVLFTANAGTLLERINRVAYATKKLGEDSREMMSCVEFVGSQILALDGYRAAWDQDSTLSFPQPFLVLAEQMHLLKLFGNTQVDFYLSHPYLYVTTGSTTVIFRTSESTPFDMHNALPQTFTEEFTVSPKTMLGELKYLNDATPKTKTPYVYLHGSELIMTVQSRKYSAVLDIDRQGAMTIGFNLRYVTEAFKQFEKEPQVKVKFSGIIGPVVIEAEGRNDCAMVLPVRATENAAA